MKAFQKLERFTVEVIILIIFMGTATAIAQSWQNTDGPWFVSNGTGISVGQKVAVGYTGGSRVIYDAAYGDSILRATGPSIRWANKGVARPEFAACEVANPSTAYTGVSNVGLFKSVNGGDSWTSINTGLTNLFVTCLSISPLNNGKLYVGGIGPLSSQMPSTEYTLHKSVNGGSNWVASEGFPQENIKVTKIVFHPQNDSIVYVSATEPNGGIYRTSDDGATWQPRTSGMDITEIRAVAVSQQIPSTLFAGSTTYIGIGTYPARIYKSTNEGITWSTPYTFSTPVFISDVVVDPTSSLIAYVTTQAYGISYPGGVLKTTDGGLTWVEKNNGIIDRDVKSIALDPNTPSTLYIATGVSFYFSTDGGESWQERTAGAEIAPTGGLVAYRDTVTSLVGTDLPLLSSRFLPNLGAWQVFAKNTQFYNGIERFLTKMAAVDKQDQNKVYAVGRIVSPAGGAAPRVIRSTDGGSSWSIIYQPINTGFVQHTVNGIAIDPNQSSKLIAVTHWDYYGSVSPIVYSTDNGNTWITPNSLVNDDYYCVAIDKSTGGGGQASTRAYVGGGGSPQLGNTRVLRTTDGGVNWTSIGVNLPQNQVVKKIAVHPFTPTTIMAGISPSGLWKSVNSGGNWQQVTSLGVTEVTAIQYHPNESGVLYVAGYNSSGNTWNIYQSVDNGATWTSLGSGFPSSLPINALVFNENSSSTYPRYLYAGTSNGVYRIDLAPFPPGNVQVANYNNNPRVTWVQNPEPDLPTNPYKVYRKIVQIEGPVIEDWRVIATVSGTSYVDADISVLPKPYHYTVYYKLTTTDLASTESAFSNQVSINVYGVNYKNAPNPEEELRPPSFGLSQNTPNPFNPVTLIKYQIPEDVHVIIKLYDLLGREVRTFVDEVKEAGNYEIRLDASTLSSSIYIYRMTAGNYVAVRKLVVTK